MEFNKDIPEMSANFCDRVIMASREIDQRQPLTLKHIIDRLNYMLPVRVNWAVAVMAVFFVVGVVMGIETYTFTDATEIIEYMEI